jgi:cysteine-rich repeat protein
VCNDAAPTTQTFVCAPEPADGFTLTPGQALVIVYHGSLSGLGFSTGAAGFGVDTNGSNPPGCAAGSIVNAAARLDNDPGLPAPTATPTATVTYTSTATRTATNTSTPTATASASATPTATPVCGDGVRQGPEECDDGNTRDGDCCSSTCRFEAPGAPCAADGNACTRDQCSGGGVCAHAPLPNGLTCEDGNRCTTAEHCVDGACAGAVPVVCNDADDLCTTDTCDPGAGCRFEVRVERPECGSCDDGIDNDGNTILDGEEPACATLNELQRFAIVGTATDGLRSLRLGREARLLESADGVTHALGTRGGACGVDLSASIGVLVTGSMALEGYGHFSGGLPPVRIMGWFANDDASSQAVQTGQTAPLVGPPSMCTDGATLCRSRTDCPVLQQCELQLPMTYPAQPWVDRSGTATDFTRCQAALAAVPITEQILFALTRTQSAGEINLRAGQHGTIELEHPDGQNIIDVDALRIGQDGALTVRGLQGADTSAAVVVLRIAGLFRIGTRSTVRLEGGLTPDHIIWTVSGAGRLVRISSRSTFPGTLFAAKRPKISIGAFTVIDGSLIGKRIRMGRASRVNHSPLVALLEGATQNSPNLAVRSVRLQSSSSQRSNGALRIGAIVDDSNTGTFVARLLAGVVSLSARDARAFNAAVALTGCTRRDERVVHCRSADGNTRANIKQLRDDPNIYNLTVQRRSLSPSATGSTQPVGPVTVTMQQDMLQRAGQIASCRPRGAAGLTCRTR